MMNVCYNQIGYYPESPKHFSVPDGPFRSFEIQTIDPSVCWKTVFRGPLERVGDRLEGDFTAVKQPADYRIVLGETNTGQAIPPERMSFNFVIKPGVYQHLARLIGEGFRWARCGHIEGWAGVCHQDPVPLVGTDRRLDVRGGYHQSCDLRNWHDAMSAAIYGVLRFVERQPADWYCGDLTGEIRWGCEYFLKVVAPEGFVYDCQFEPIGWGPRNYYRKPTTLDAHYNCVRLLARASRWFGASDPSFADRCRETAVRIRRFTVSAPIFNESYRQPVPDLPPGSLGSDCFPQSFRESFSMLAVSIVADLDLWQATGEEPYRARAVQTSKQVMALQ